MRPFELSEEQRAILRNVVSSQVYRDPRTGMYALLGGMYHSLEEAEAAALARCIGERKPPLSMFHDFEKAQAREKELERHNILKNLESPEEYRARTDRRDYAEKVGTERIKDMARKLTWKEWDL
jgi:hypothetical protein